ncbi:MAG: hypothetical protein Q9195_000684 [Heterodermia aff. obscurata]
MAMALKPRHLSLNSRHIAPPIFLCPEVARLHSFRLSVRKNFFKAGRRQVTNSSLRIHSASPAQLPPHRDLLPFQCPGCGAFTQVFDPGHAGYYSPSRRSVKTYLAQREAAAGQTFPSEAETFDQVLKNADETLLKTLGLDNASLDKSPYKYNHVYHVLDAADFPLSLVPRLQQHLSLTPQRSLNRRSKARKFYHGRNAEMSFIITRSDLLAPRKEQVDSLMPYLIEVLRDALGHTARDVRLGNVRCVSSKRGWWTKEIKEAIWDRGGAGWMVGKVNVGKSNLLECIFPKGRNQEVECHSLRHAAKPNFGGTTSTPEQDSLVVASPQDEKNAMSGNSLLPPAPPEERFPIMPIVSSIPGTTASPIRLLFGSGKGELIDLPGLARDSLDEYVLDEHKQDMVMRHRVTPDQITIKPGQSLLVGGLLRITPTNPDHTWLAYPFLPFKCHVTSTEKAISLQTREGPSGVPTLAKPGVGDLVRSAGVFRLKWDVTKQRAGPLTRASAVGLKVQTLPFVVFSADVLIEGCGWIELVVQIRKRAIESHANDSEDSYDLANLPGIEVFSPNGEHVGMRRPMNAWLSGGPKPVAVANRSARPRRSMKGVKKNLKKLARAAAGM